MQRTAIKALDDKLAPFLAQCDDALGNAYSAVLFGSGARGEWVEGRSNINMLLVLDPVTPTALRKLGQAFRTFADVSDEPPLLLSREEWRESADAFPIEITDMRTAYRVLRGEDPLLDVLPHEADLRLQLEREFRGKLLQLRRGFVLQNGDERALGWLAARSAPTFVLLSRCALVLLKESVPPTALGVVERAAARLGFDPAPLLNAIEHRSVQEWRVPVQDFLAYLDSVETAMHAVDQLPMGD